MFRSLEVTEGLVWVPADAGADPWTVVIPLGYVIMGCLSFKNELYGVDDSGACAKFRTAEAREKGCAAMSMEEKAARMSQYTDSRGGMMMVYAVPVVVHIMAWDLALRQIPEYPELFQSNFAAPDMGIYHYLIGTLLGLHLLRRFVEVLFIHEYTADIKLSTVISLGAQSAVDVALMDYYLFNTALDFAGGGWNVFVWGGVGLWITGQMGAMKHHWLLCMTRGPGAPGDLAAAAQSHGTPNQANAPAALETVKGGGGGSAKKKAKIISRRAKASVAEAPQDVAVAKTTATMASTNGYVSPQLIGGMFDTIACPHYMYEACTWLGMAVLARHIFSWALAVQVFLTLAGRARRTMFWYREQFDAFPKSITSIIPYVY